MRKTKTQKTIRKKFPQVYRIESEDSVTFQISARSRRWGVNFSKFRATEKEALEFARNLEKELHEKGADTINENVVITDSKFSVLVDRLKIHGKTIDDAVDHYIKFLGEEIKTNAIPLISELVKQWETSKINSKIKPLSKRTQTEIKSYSKWIERTFGTLRPNQVTTELCEAKFNKLNVSNVTHRKYRLYLGMFFLWCIKRKYATDNPASNIPIGHTDKEIQIYEIEQIKTILDLAKTETFQPLLGFYVLETFLGLRPTEAQRVEWSHINFKTKEIHVKKGKTPARFFSMNDTAIKWLQYVKALRPTETLNPTKAHTNLQREFRDTFEFEWIADGLRHCYGTFHYNQCKNIHETVYTMGNSVRVARKHYTKGVEQSKVVEFWSLNP